MGAITLEKADHLYWLGRYSERVYTTLKLYCDGYDTMIDREDDYHGKLCELLDIPDIYTSKEDFISRYGYDRTDPNSILSNLLRAYDNAIVMRDEIGTETLAYIQMALYRLESAAVSRAPMMMLQKVVDNLLAFWGCVDDQIDSYSIRSVMKFGKRVERLDLYLRFHRSPAEIYRNYMRLLPRANDSGMAYNKTAMAELKKLIEAPEIDYDAALVLLGQILDV